MKLSHSRSNSKRASLTRAAASGSKSKRKQKMFTRASPMKLTRLYRHMSKDQKEIVEKADFSGLLQIKCSKLRPDLCKYLMESFDPTQCAMVFPGRGTIPITEEYVQEVLCIPRGTEEVRYELDREATSYMLAEFGNQGSKHPTMSNLEHILINTKTADNRYLRLWVVYAICSVLAPTTGINVSPRCYPSLMHLDPKKAKGLNFCRLVIQILCSTAKSGKNIFNACMMFMMIKYIDSLECPELEVCPDGPRVSAWSTEMVTKVIDADQSANGSFGKLQFKEQFRQRTQHMLSNNLTNIGSFVQQNTLEDCTSNGEVTMKLLHSRSNSKRASSTRAAASGRKSKRKQKMFTRASPMKLTRLYRHISKDQKEIVEKADFSGLLQIKCSKLRPDLCKYLMKSFDPTQCAMVFPGRGTIPVTEEYVQEVLCIPRGAEEVRYELDQEATSYMLAEFGNQGSKHPTMSNLEHILINTKTADNRYLRLWVVYAVCSVLAPTTGLNVSPRCYPSLMHLDPKKAKGLNFCRLVIQILCSTAKAGKNIFNACMLFMMIKYIDSLEFPELDVCPDGPRVSAWSNEMVTKVIDADQSANGSFGMLQFKEQFRQKTQHMLFNNLTNIESFAQQNTPEGCTSNGEVTMKRSHSRSNSKRASSTRASASSDKFTSSTRAAPSGNKFASSTRAAASGNKFKRKQKMFTRASPMKLTRLYRHMSKDQKEIVEKADFSGLLQIKCSKLRPDLCKYLMENFDPTQCAMVFPGRGTIPVTEEYVQEVLCIPRGTEEVTYELDQEAISNMLAEFGIQGSKQPTMSNLENILIKTKTADNRYLRLWVVYAVCSVLAPTTGINVSPRCYPSLMHLDPKKAKGLNFCRLVIQILCSTAKAGKNIFNACMLFMMIKYIDSLEFPELEVCPDGPRVSAWSNEMVTKVIDADQSANGSFGKLQFKEKFRQRTKPMLFNNLTNIESFVQQNTPEDCPSNELLRYKEAAKGACAEFEGLLQRFIRKASGLDDSHGSNKGVKRKSPQTRKARTTKKQRVDTSGTDQQHASAVPVSSSSSADADEVSAFGTEEEHVPLMTVPPSPGEHNANNSDADYKCNSHEATVSSEDVTLDDEVSDDLDDQQQEVSEDSDFMQLAKQVRPQVTMKATSRKQSQGEENSSKGLREETVKGGFLEQDTTTGEIPIKRTTDTSPGFKIKDTHADNPCSAANVPIHVAGSLNILADLCKIYESGNKSIREAEEGKDAEHPILITSRSAKNKTLLMFDMESSKTTISQVAGCQNQEGV